MTFEVNEIIMILSAFYSLLIGGFSFAAYHLGKKHGAKYRWVCLNCQSEGDQK